MSLPSKAILDSLPLLENGNPDTSKLPRETLRNTLLNCLTNYVVKDKKEIFMVNATAQAIIGDEPTVELKDKLHKFLIDVVYAMTLQDNGKEQSGLYYSWVTSQVLEELGVRNDE